MKLIRLSILALCLSLLAACGGSGNSNNNNGSDPNALTEAEGGKYYGGVFKFNETEYLRSLYPLNITEVVGHRIANQVYEGLVKLNQETLVVEPCLAESWEIDSSATVYTFKIREGVYFHDDGCFADGKGRELTAHDFVYVFDKLAGYEADNNGFWVIDDIVKGANEYNWAQELSNRLLDSNPDADAQARIEELRGWLGGEMPETVSGVEALDDYTLRITLEKPFAAFLYRLSLPFTFAFPKEAVQAYGNEMREITVGTGPFMLKNLLYDEAVILERNPNYWDVDEHGNQLPYLNGIKISFIKEEKVELLEFNQGNLDMKYRLPLEMVDEVLDVDGNLMPDYQKYQLQEAVEMTIQYYGYLTVQDPFDDVRVRQAFNYAIDREAIVNFTMKGQGLPAVYGVVPVAFANYKNENVKGYTHDPAKAQQLMAEAGYPNGEGFPKVTLQLNSGGGRNVNVAEAIQQMITETLNIELDIQQVTWSQHTETIETAKVKFWRLGWVADYPDPENFLNLFYSMHVPPSLDEKAYINSFRYKNPAYDKVFEKALSTVDEEERNRLYEQADQIMIDDAVIMPIFYSKNNRLLQPYVKNFPQNPMEYRILREVYFVPGES